MNALTSTWTEIIANAAGLIILWILIVAMLRRRPFLQTKDRQVGTLFIMAFVVLAIGRTLHTGLRALALSQGQPVTSPAPGDTSWLVGIGALAAAAATALFFIEMAVIWRRRFKKPYGPFGILLILAGLAGLVILVLPQNQWDLILPPQPWALYRMIPLAVIGLGVAFLFIRDGAAAGERLFVWSGTALLLALAFSILAILLAPAVPMAGLLTIGATIAYLVIAFLAYNELFRSKLGRRAQAKT